MNEIYIIDFKVDLEEGFFSLVINFYLLIVIIILIFFTHFVIKKINKRKHKYTKMELIKLKYSFSGQEVEYEIKKDFNNIEIAHRIYVELITRKAALPIDEANDVITEVYNSWCSLFQITRHYLQKKIKV